MDIVVRPLITEKSLGLASRGWYAFVVAKDADKNAIAREVAALYGVTVTGVRTIAMHGKMRRTGRASKPAKRADWKKALVTVAKGQKIDAFEVMTQGEAPAAK